MPHSEAELYFYSAGIYIKLSPIEWIICITILQQPENHRELKLIYIPRKKAQLKFSPHIVYTLFYARLVNRKKCMD